MVLGSRIAIPALGSRPVPPGSGLFWQVALALFALFLVAQVRPATAQDVFTVKDVPTEATAANASLARDRAIALGTDRALRNLLQRLTRRSDWPALPRPGAAAAADMAEGFELKDEQPTPTRYAARMTVHFRPQLVRDLLRRSGIGYAEALAPPVIVLPVYEWAGSKVLWDDPNPWRDAWARRTARSDGLVPMPVAQGDLSDKAALSADQAVEGDAARIQAIARRYNADSAIVLRAVHSVDPRNGRPVMEVTMTRYGTEAGPAGPAERVLGKPNEPVEELAISTTVQTRCLAGKVYVAVRAENGEDAPVAVRLVTPFGTKELAAVAPGANAYQSFATRATSVEAGTVTVEATRGSGDEEVTASIDSDYAAVTCG